MGTPVALLRFVGKALLNTAGAGLAGEFPVEVLPEVVKDVWNWWSQDRSEAERHAEVEALVQAPAHSLRQVVREIVAELATHESQPVRDRLTAYLMEVPP